MPIRKGGSRIPRATRSSSPTNSTISSATSRSKRHCDLPHEDDYSNDPRPRSPCMRATAYLHLFAHGASSQGVVRQTDQVRSVPELPIESFPHFVVLLRVRYFVRRLSASLGAIRMSQDSELRKFIKLPRTSADSSGGELQLKRRTVDPERQELARSEGIDAIPLNCEVADEVVESIRGDK
ncbi:hypothetical protein PIB30_063767 [Stylosanthes scabra]|uniref:Uncharacterized protein n=1 Tax=Stylosanthes scabra TaxID=79078 RepID=A0ABU6VNX6_9FABA|nr:hypothetical protein [Stylosanthes scabra]